MHFVTIEAIMRRFTSHGRADQMSSSLLRYSPTSAWLITTTCVGSISRHYCVVFMHMPKPRGISEIENTTTPILLGVFSVILAR